jgi:ferritin
MAAPAFVERLNEQIGHEFSAHQQYVAIAAYYDALTMPQMAALFYAQAQEERDHAMMMVQYLLDADHVPAIPALPAPRFDFTDVVEPVAVHVTDLRPDPHRAGERRLRVRPVHAVVHQGAGRGAVEDE